MEYSSLTNLPRLCFASVPSFHRFVAALIFPVSCLLSPSSFLSYHRRPLFTCAPHRVPFPPRLEFGLLCGLIFALNWGVNVSTYVLPTEAFPSEIRSSFFGVSAAMAKFGALLGTIIGYNSVYERIY